MKGLVLFLIAVCFVVMPVLADCPVVDYHDYDVIPPVPDCIPCDIVPYGNRTTVTLFAFDDGSEITMDYQEYFDCHGHYVVFINGSEKIICPNGPDNPCAARDIFY